MKKFYDMPKPVQWIVSIVLIVGGFGVTHLTAPVFNPHPVTSNL